MAVFQQIVKDKISGTPASTLLRTHANEGRLVIFSSSQTGRNKSAFGSPVCELTSNPTFPSDSSAVMHTVPKGVVGDYHSSRQISVIRKGRVKIRRSSHASVPDVDDTSIGMKIFAMADGTATLAIAQSSDWDDTSGSESGYDESADSTGFGEVIGYDDTYFIVDINFPA